MPLIEYVSIFKDIIRSRLLAIQFYYKDYGWPSDKKKELALAHLTSLNSMKLQRIHDGAQIPMNDSTHALSILDLAR